MKNRFTLLSALTSMCLALTGCDLVKNIFSKGDNESKHIHSYILVEEEKSSCIHHGHASYFKCENCSLLFDFNTKEEIEYSSVELPLSDHNYTFVDRQEPMYGRDGYEAYYECSICKKIFDLSKNEIDELVIIKPGEKIVILDRFDGKTVDLQYSQARDFLKTDDTAAFLYSYSSSPGEYTKGIELKWQFNGQVNAPFIEVAEDSDFTKFVYTQPVSVTQSLTLYNLVPGTYYYRIKSNDFVSEYDSFTIKDGIRGINTDAGIYNMRDLGGWSTDENKTVKYGLLYRSAHWQSATGTTDLRLKNLKMKTELDIRRSSGSNDYSTSQHPINGINFINYGIGQYTQIVPGGNSYYLGAMQNLSSIFTVLADKNNYPLTYHCTAGADRTGTLSFLILGLLGVSYEDICRDFELTSIYYNKRWRSNINYVDGSYVYDESGIMQNDSSNYVAFDLLYKTMINTYVPEDGKLSTSIEKYLKSALQVNSNTINKIKEILT